jgi:hypothetical protein
MKEWKEVEEDGMKFWISDVGNIVKTGDDSYVSIFPKMMKLGPFKTLELCQEALEGMHEHKEQLEDIIQQFYFDVVRKSK